MIAIKSKIAKALLSHFFLHSGEELYINEITVKFKLDKRNLVKKLKEYEKEGLFKSKKMGNQIYYSLNRKYPLYNEYKKIVLKTIGIENNLSEILKRVKGIKKAYIFGSYASDKMDLSSDIDLLVIGDIDTIELHKILLNLQKSIDREINPVNMTENEFKKRKTKKDSFIRNVLSGKKIRVK
ncbi:nucleotidyltransferase domain-containing protein [bacterium]|nr:nucleotidyltransferase domain-containing protein [bacterium]MBU3956350.1 nucleotidyltransferase domain-containing protein [bacterium]